MRARTPSETGDDASNRAWLRRMHIGAGVRIRGSSANDESLVIDVEQLAGHGGASTAGTSHRDSQELELPDCLAAVRDSMSLSSPLSSCSHAWMMSRRLRIPTSVHVCARVGGLLLALLAIVVILANVDIDASTLCAKHDHRYVGAMVGSPPLLLVPATGADLSAALEAVAGKQHAAVPVSSPKSSAREAAVASPAPVKLHRTSRTVFAVACLPRSHASLQPPLMHALQAHGYQAVHACAEETELTPPGKLTSFAAAVKDIAASSSDPLIVLLDGNDVVPLRSAQEALKVHAAHAYRTVISTDTQCHEDTCQPVTAWWITESTLGEDTASVPSRRFVSSSVVMGSADALTHMLAWQMDVLPADDQLAMSKYVLTFPQLTSLESGDHLTALIVDGRVGVNHTLAGVAHASLFAHFPDVHASRPNCYLHAAFLDASSSTPVQRSAAFDKMERTLYWLHAQMRLQQLLQRRTLLLFVLALLPLLWSMATLWTAGRWPLASVASLTWTSSRLLASFWTCARRAAVTCSNVDTIKMGVLSAARRVGVILAVLLVGHLLLLALDMEAPNPTAIRWLVQLHGRGVPDDYAWPIALQHAQQCGECGCGRAADRLPTCMTDDELRDLVQRDAWPAPADLPRDGWPSRGGDSSNTSTCFSLAANTHSTPVSADSQILFHIYVRTDISPMGFWDAAMLQSYIGTQNLQASTLVVWSPDDRVVDQPILQLFFENFPANIRYRVWRPHEEAIGTPLQGHIALSMRDRRGWVDGDIFRLIVLYRYGGVYLDTDVLLSRDVAPLLSNEFVTEFACDTMPTRPDSTNANNAVMRLKARSGAAEALIQRAARAYVMPESWGYGPYVLRDVLQRNAYGMRVAPWCFFHGYWCPQAITPAQVLGGEAWDAQHATAMFGLHYHGVLRHKMALSGMAGHLFNITQIAAADVIAARDSKGASGTAAALQMWRQATAAAMERTARFEAVAGSIAVRDY